MIDRLLVNTANKKAPPEEASISKTDQGPGGDEDPIMNSLQTRLKLEGIDLGIKGVGIVNIDGVDQSLLMQPHKPQQASNMNHGFMNQIKDDGEIQDKFTPPMDEGFKPNEPHKAYKIVPIAFNDGSEIIELPKEPQSESEGINN